MPPRHSLLLPLALLIDSSPLTSLRTDTTLLPQRFSHNSSQINASTRILLPRYRRRTLPDPSPVGINQATLQLHGTLHHSCSRWASAAAGSKKGLTFASSSVASYWRPSTLASLKAVLKVVRLLQV